MKEGKLGENKGLKDALADLEHYLQQRVDGALAYPNEANIGQMKEYLRTVYGKNDATVDQRILELEKRYPFRG